jgi:transposase InsO family protein
VLTIAPASVKAPPGSLAAVVAAGPPLDLAAIAPAQLTDQETQQAASSGSPHLRVVTLGGHNILCDTSKGSIRPLIPVAARRQVFSTLHGLAHPGGRASRRLIASRVAWRGMSADITAWCKDCQSCARAKVTRQLAIGVEPIAIPGHRFTHIHLDIVGPLPASSDGAAYLLTMIDRSTRWLEAVPLSSTEATTCTAAFLSTWVARFGVPAVVTTDRGPQFTGHVWAEFCKKLGIQHITTTAFHPQSNGMVERSHRQLKDALRACLAGNEWPLHLPWVLLGLRAAPKEDTAVSSAELVFGASVSLPGQFLASSEPPAEAFLEQNRIGQPPPPSRPLSYAQMAASPSASLMSAAFVYVRKGGTVPSLAPLYTGPYAVRQRHRKFFILEVGGGLETVSTDRLNPTWGRQR